MTDQHGDAVYTMRLNPDGKLHAAEEWVEWLTIEGTRIALRWYRPACQRAWRTPDSTEVFDYRYREGPLCRTAACQRAFREVLVG